MFAAVSSSVSIISIVTLCHWTASSLHHVARLIGIANLIQHSGTTQDQIALVVKITREVRKTAKIWKTDVIVTTKDTLPT